MIAAVEHMRRLGVLGRGWTWSDLEVDLLPNVEVRFAAGVWSDDDCSQIRRLAAAWAVATCPSLPLAVLDYVSQCLGYGVDPALDRELTP